MLCLVTLLALFELHCRDKNLVKKINSQITDSVLVAEKLNFNVPGDATISCSHKAARGRLFLSHCTMTSRFGVAGLLVATLIVGTNGFVAPTPSTAAAAARIGTERCSSKTEIEILPNLPPIKDISYGEESRKYRRTVYSHDDWRKHRSPDRFIYYLTSFVFSGVYKNIGREVLATTSIATLVFLYNAIVGGYVDFEGVQHASLVTSPWLSKAGLPLTPFTLSTSSLGLLLGMLCNSSQGRCVCLEILS